MSLTPVLATMSRTVVLSYACLVPLLVSCSGGNDGGGKSSCDPASVVPDLPLDYTIEVDALGDVESVMVQTAGGPVRMVFTPWGPHAEPHTGHPGGDGKTNWLGYLAPTRSELEELSGDGDMVCETGEICGLPESEVLARRPRYIAPDDGFEITSVVLDRIHPPGSYWGTLNHWRIDAVLCGYAYSFGHVGWIAEDLRARMLAVGVPDPDTYSGPTWQNLLPSSVFLDRGQSVAIPQIVGQTDGSHPGYVLGDVWAQMEVPTWNQNTHRAEPVFRWLSTERQDQLRQILWREMQDASSRMYSGWPTFAWLWKAEADLWTVESSSQDDYGSLTSNLGIWFENRMDGSACSGGTDVLCDQAFSIWAILKTNPIYDAGLYDAPEVAYLVVKSKRGDTYYRGEVVAPAPSLPASSGTMLIKWRLESYLTPMETYQKVTYALSSSAKRLKLHWGTEDASRAVVEASADPSDPASLACDGASVTCMNHDWPTAGPLPGY